MNPNQTLGTDMVVFFLRETEATLRKLIEEEPEPALEDVRWGKVVREMSKVHTWLKASLHVAKALPTPEDRDALKERIRPIVKEIRTLYEKIPWQPSLDEMKE